MIEQIGALHLLRVARRIRTEIFVADDLRVRAHLLFGANAQHAKRAIVERLQRLDRRVLLHRFRSEEEELLSELQRLLHRRIKHGHRFSNAGRRGDEQRFLLIHGARDGGDHLLLPGAHLRERKGERVRERALRDTQRDGGLEIGDEPLQPLVQRLDDAIAIELRIDRFRVAGNQINEHELRDEREAVKVRLTR